MSKFSPRVIEVIESIPMNSSYLTSHAAEVEESPKGAIMSTF